MGRGFLRMLVAVCGSAALIGGAIVLGSGSAAAAPSALRVGCGHGALTTISEAVTSAGAGDTILVCPGTYQEMVTVPADKPLTIDGLGHVVIDATGYDNGVLVLASHTTIEGLTVEHATGEGILVQGSVSNPVTDVTISANTVVNNDQGNPTSDPTVTDSSYPQCNAVTSPGGTIPGDCGEGLHLWSVTDSTVVGNVVSHNSGGILLSDETGPTSGNVIASNQISDNPYDCGVTLAGHNPAATGNAAAGGLYDNTVTHNAITDNGYLGEGGGVLMASPLPGAAVYDNTIVGNRISGNGLAGVTVHSHVPGQDFSGNVIEGNLIKTNNLIGDRDFFPLVDLETTGVLVGSVTPLSITISHNVIVQNTYGVWMTPLVTVTGIGTNVFGGNVTTPVYPPTP